MSGLAFYAVPQLLKSPEDEIDIAVAAATEPNLESSTTTAEPTATSTPPIAVTETTPTPRPTNTPTPSPTATQDVLAEAPPTVRPSTEPIVEPIVAESSTIEATTIDQAWIFTTQDESSGWTGFYFYSAEPLSIKGRSEDSVWLHVLHANGLEGWVYASAIEAEPATLAALQVSTYVGEQAAMVEQAAEINVQAATATPEQVAAVIQPTGISPTNQPEPTNTPQPTWTPWPTRTPTPIGAWPTATSTTRPFATNTPRPTNTPQTVATNTPAAQWNPTNTPVPTWTPRPTNTPAPTRTPFPTAAPLPQPTATAAAPATGGDAEQDQPSAETNAIAWWQHEGGSISTNANGTWRGTILVRVPTSFQYQFEMENLGLRETRATNDDGDDIFALTVSGMRCGERYSSDLVARQNGARMDVMHEFTLSSGPVGMDPPC